MLGRAAASPAEALGTEDPFTGERLVVPSVTPPSITLTVPALESASAVPLPSVDTTTENSVLSQHDSVH